MAPENILFVDHHMSHAASAMFCSPFDDAAVLELIKLRRDIDWGRIMDHARDLGIHRMVCCGLSLASQLLGAELEEEMLRRMRVDPFVQSITDQVIRKLFKKTEGRRKRFEREMFYLRMMERLEHKARYCFYLVMNPTHAEWSTLPLSKPLYFLYYFIRPFRLIGKYMKKGTGYFLVSRN